MIPDLYDRKLGLLEILSASWRIYTANFKFLLLFVFCSNFLAYRLNYVFVVRSGLKVGMPYWVPSVWNLQVVFVSFVIALSLICVVQITEIAAGNKSVSLRGVCRVLRRSWPTIFVCLIFLVWRLIMFLPIPIACHADLSRGGRVALSSVMALMSLMVWVCTVFVYPLIGLKNKSVSSAFHYSFTMVRRRWWQMLWAWIVLTLPAGVVCFLLQRVVEHFGLVDIGRQTVGQHALWSLYSLVNAFSMVGITILFLSIDQKEEASDPVDPVNPV